MIREGGLSTNEWITILCTILAAGVGVTVYASNQFAPLDGIRRMKDQIDHRMDRLEDLIIADLRSRNIPVPAKRYESE